MARATFSGGGALFGLVIPRVRIHEGVEEAAGAGMADQVVTGADVLSHKHKAKRMN